MAGTKVAIEGGVIPRSVQFAHFGEVDYLLLGMGDGKLHSWSVLHPNGAQDAMEVD